MLNEKYNQSWCNKFVSLKSKVELSEKPGSVRAAKTLKIISESLPSKHNIDGKMMTRNSKVF